MGKKKEEKTNAMRLLDQAGVPYQVHTYDHEDGKIDGVAVAEKLGQPLGQVFKTLVTKGPDGFFVFVIPVAEELDLKAAARSAGEKRVELLAVKELLPATGYIRGGCSPIGMKKRFPTVLDKSAEALETLMVSGGKIGVQVELSPQALVTLLSASFAPLTVES